jgi:hypothetical protein
MRWQSFCAATMVVSTVLLKLKSHAMAILLRGHDGCVDRPAGRVVGRTVARHMGCSRRCVATFATQVVVDVGWIPRLLRRRAHEIATAGSYEVTQVVIER